MRFCVPILVFSFIAIGCSKSPEEQFRLGVMYDMGEGVPEDNAEAVKWYRLAAEQGHVEAQHDLGVMYKRGEGVPQDYTEAAKWYRLAAEQGHVTAQANLGLMCYEGKGVPSDLILSYAWVNLAAAKDSKYQEVIELFHQEMTSEQITEAQKISRELFNKIKKNTWL